jgi:hypothetical protein
MQVFPATSKFIFNAGKLQTGLEVKAPTSCDKSNKNHPFRVVFLFYSLHLFIFSVYLIKRYNEENYR